MRAAGRALPSPLSPLSPPCAAGRGGLGGLGARGAPGPSPSPHGPGPAARRSLAALGPGAERLRGGVPGQPRPPGPRPARPWPLLLAQGRGSGLWGSRGARSASPRGAVAPLWARLGCGAPAPSDVPVGSMCHSPRGLLAAQVVPGNSGGDER